MPAGSHWTLRYEPTVDERIRVDAERLRADEFVRDVTVRGSRTSCTIEVQFADDREAPYDDRLRHEIEGYRVLPPTPPEPRALPRTREEILNEALSTPIGRRMVAQSWAQPLRRNIDYTSVARRTLLIPDFEPRDIAEVPPLSNSQFGDAVNAMMYANLQVPGSMLTGVPLEVFPEWLKLGVWIRHSKDTFAEVVKLENAGAAVGGAHVFFKLWRIKAPVQSLCLIDFRKNWVPCERPIEPLSRYKRILKGF